MRSLVLATSLYPGNFEKQNRAVQTWSTTGARVLSVNSPEEIVVLAPHFPTVEFVAVQRNAKEITGRPLVFFDDVLHALARCSEDVVGFINSDILLDSQMVEQGEWEQALHLASSHLVVANRMEISPEGKEHSLYGLGFDLFLFPPSLASMVPASRFAIGAPWWDYWFPLWCIFSGFPILQWIVPGVRHPSHPARWDEKSFDLYARELAQHFSDFIDVDLLESLPIRGQGFGNRLCSLAIDVLWKRTGLACPVHFGKHYSRLAEQLQQTGNPRFAFRLAAKAMRYGLPETAALAAKAMGSLEVGPALPIFVLEDRLVSIRPRHSSVPEKVIPPIQVTAPRISIVIPCYNSGKYLRKCLDSLLSQQDPSLEIIVMDGGSQDNTVDILNEYSSKIAYWESKKDAGQSDAIQKGLERSTGIIWNWLCADDWLLPGALAAIRRTYEASPNAVAWIGGCQRLHENGWLHYISWPTVLAPEHIRTNFSARSFYQPAAFLNREFVNRAGGVRAELRYAMEYDLYSRLIPFGKFVGIDEVIAVALAQPNAKTVTAAADAWREKVPLLRGQGLEAAAKMLEQRIDTGVHDWVWPGNWRDHLLAVGAPVHYAEQFQKRTLHVVVMPPEAAALAKALQAFQELLQLMTERFGRLTWLVYAPDSPDLQRALGSMPEIRWIASDPDWAQTFAVWEAPRATLPKAWPAAMAQAGVPLLAASARFAQLELEADLDGVSGDWTTLCWKGILLRLDPLVWGAQCCMILARAHDNSGELRRRLFQRHLLENTKPIRINLFIMREYHIPVLEPLWRELQKRQGIEVGFTYHPFVPAQGEVNEIGLRPETVRDLEQKGWKSWPLSVGNVPETPFAAVVTADACYEMVEGWGPIVCVGHGTISKNLYFIDKPICRRENLAALMCVPGPGYVHSYGNQVHTRIVPTGFTKMDELAQDASLIRREVCTRLGLNPEKKILLYAPTFNPELSSVDLFRDAWESPWIAPWQVIVKLHGSARAEVRQYFEQLCAQQQNVFLAREGSLSPLLLAADVVVSDYSSAFLEAMAVGRPVVIGHNPAMENTPWYNPDSIEWKARAYAHVAHNTAQLQNYLQQLATGPDPKQRERERFVQQLFNPLDGNNCKRIADALVDLAQNAEAALPPGARPVTVWAPPQATASAKALLERSSAFGVRYAVEGETPALPCLIWDGQRQFGPQWDRDLWTSTRLDPTSVQSLWAPILPDEEASPQQSLHLRVPNLPILPWKILRNHAKMNFQSESLPIQGGPKDVFYVPAGFATAVWGACWQQGQFNRAQLVAQSASIVRASWFAESLPAKVLSTVARASKTPRIALYALRELHLPVLLPVYEEVRKISGVEVGFIAPPFFAGDANMPEEGLRPETLRSLQERGIPFWGHEKPVVPYKCVVTADACADRIEGFGPIVCVGHGTISKNIYFIDQPLVRRESFQTVLCVPGPWYVNSFGGHVKTRIVPTGFPKMDDLARDYSEERDALFQRIGFRKDRKTIVYAPTYNLEFTSLGILIEEWAKLDAGQWQVLVKLHGATDTKLRDAYRKLCTLLRDRFHYVEDQNLAPYLKMADVVISDVSSAYVEAYAVGVPVIVVENPEMYSFSGYNPVAVEFKVRDGAYIVREGRDLHAILNKLSQGIDPLASKRREYAQLLFPPIDGQNSRRVAEVVQEVIAETIVREPVHSIRVIVTETAVQSRVQELLKKCAYPHKVYTQRELSSISEETALWIVLTGEHDFPEEWDLLYDFCFQFNPEIQVLGPVFEEGQGPEAQAYYQHLGARVNAVPDIRRKWMKYTQFFVAKPSAELVLEGLALRGKLSGDDLRILLENGGWQGVSSAVCLGVLARNFQ